MPPRRRRTLGRAAAPHAELLAQLNTRIPRELRQRMRLVCVERGREVQAFVAEAIREYLRRQQRR